MVEYGDPIDPTIHGRFTMIPDWLARRPELPPGAKLVYARLERYYNKAEGHSYPGKANLAGELGMPIRTIFDHLDRLAVAGLIRIVVRGRNLPNVYQPLHHPWREEGVARAETAQRSGKGSAESSHGSAGTASRSAVSADPLQDTTQETTEETTGLLAAGMQKSQSARTEAVMAGAFQSLWREHVGERAAKALTARQVRDALDLWNRAIEVGRGDLVEDAVRRAATNADVNRWGYFTRTLSGMLRDAQPASAREDEGRQDAATAEQFRRVLARHAAGEQINPLVLAEARAWHGGQGQGQGQQQEECSDGAR